jgi:carboxymethylenebutenolidase
LDANRWEAFYSQYLIPQAPPDIEIILISRTIGVDRLVDELMLERFLQDVEES